MPSKRYRIEYNKTVLKFLKKHQELHVRFFDKIQMLQNNPFDPALDIKTLQWEEKGSLRLRIGKYRFKYTIIEDQIIIYFYDADSRGDVY